MLDRDIVQWANDRVVEIDKYTTSYFIYWVIGIIIIIMVGLLLVYYIYYSSPKIIQLQAEHQPQPDFQQQPHYSHQPHYSNQSPISLVYSDRYYDD